MIAARCESATLAEASGTRLRTAEVAFQHLTHRRPVVPPGVTGIAIRLLPGLVSVSRQT